MDYNINHLFEIALKAAIEAKKVAKKFILSPQVISSDFKDIKTLVDYEMNEIITSHLISTHIPILSEEGEKKCNKNLFWIVDPLDGTFNFTRGFGCYSVSISLWENDFPIVGIVYDIFNNKIYTSKKSFGARLGHSKLNVSTTQRIQDAILATGFPSGANYQTDVLLSVVTKIQLFKKIRAIGSASIMLSYVASGVFDVYYEKNIYLWDVAAGLALVEEAGGKFFIKYSGKDFKYEVLASNNILFEECKNILF